LAETHLPPSCPLPQSSKRHPATAAKAGAREAGVSASSRSSTSARITGIALGWIGATTALASVVGKPNSSCSPSTGALFGPLTPRQRVQRSVRAKRGLSSARANQMGVLRGFVSAYSQKHVSGTMYRLPLPTHRRRCGLFVFLMLPFLLLSSVAG